MFLHEWNWDKALEVTKKEAWEDGSEERAIKIAKSLRAKGMGVNEVAEMTDLTVDDVLRL